MIGIGTDLVEVARVERVWSRTGKRFAQRILTAQEQARCEHAREPWRFLAKRFAGKEAIAKAFATGIGAQLSWHDIEIVNASGGAPTVTLSPTGEALAKKLGASRVLLSLSDEKAYALAFAMLLE